MSDQTWVVRLHSAAQRLQDILQDTAPINWWNVYFETDSERSAASTTTGPAAPAPSTTQGPQASSAQQTTGSQLPAFGTLSASTNQGHQFRPASAAQGQIPSILGRTSAQGGLNTQNAADFLGNGSVQRTSSAAQVPATGPRDGSFIGGYGNVVTGPPVTLQYGAAHRAGQGQSMHGSIVDGGRGVAGDMQQPVHRGTPNGFPALLYPSNAPFQPPNAWVSNNVIVGSNATEECTTQNSTPHRGSTRSGTFRGVSSSTGSGTPRGPGVGGRRGNTTRGGLTRRQEFNLRRMAELANGTAVQTAGPVQEVLNRAAPLVQNGPVPNPLTLAGDLRQEFEDSDLSRPGPFFTRNAATGAGARGSNQAGNVVSGGNGLQAGNATQHGNVSASDAVDDGDAEDSENADDQDEAAENPETEDENVSEQALDDD